MFMSAVTGGDIHIDKQLSQLKTVSDKIRYLAKQGWERADIAKKLNKRYQHVRNVLVHEEEKVKQQSEKVESVLFDKLHKIASAEGESFQSLLDEALRDFIEKKRNAKARPHVMAAYQQSIKKFDSLYDRLAK